MALPVFLNPLRDLPHKVQLTPALEQSIREVMALDETNPAFATNVSALADQLVDQIEHLRHAQHEAHEAGSVEEEARVFVETVIPAQNELREVADELETLVADDLWPLPKYRELLFQY